VLLILYVCLALLFPHNVLSLAENRKSGNSRHVMVQRCRCMLYIIVLLLYILDT